MEPSTQTAEIKIESVVQLIELVELRPEHKAHHSHKRLWFRGQVNAAWDLQPKVFRGDYKPNGGSAHEIERDRLVLEQHASQEFRALGAANLTGHESDVELYFLQQHHGMRTRLLDWTSNPLVALWFAVGGSQYPPCKNEEKTDAAFYLMDAYVMKNLPEYFGIASPYNSDLQKAIHTITKWGKVEDLPRCIIPARPAHNIARVRQQSSFFTFHAAADDGHTDLSQVDNSTLVKCIIPAENKSAIMETLRHLGIDAYSVYGGLDNLSAELEHSYIGRWKQ